jgi:ArsR family transcriptional regulator
MSSGKTPDIPLLTRQAVAGVLRVLGHADRLAIINHLSRQRMSVSELAETLDLAPNAVSQHLNLMLARGILSRRRVGRRVYYDVEHPAAKSLLQCMRRNLDGL